MVKQTILKQFSQPGYTGTLLQSFKYVSPNLIGHLLELFKKLIIFFGVEVLLFVYKDNNFGSFTSYYTHNLKHY
jgi:hypothetical protein